MISTEDKIKFEKYQERRNAIKKAIDEILKTPVGVDRWRKSIALYLNINPVGEDGLSAKQQYNMIAEDNKGIRELQRTKFAENETGSMRYGLNAPPWFMSQIELFDKISFDSTNPQAKRNFRKLCKEFPEFKIAEKQ